MNAPRYLSRISAAVLLFQSMPRNPSSMYWFHIQVLMSATSAFFVLKWRNTVAMPKPAVSAISWILVASIVFSQKP